MFTELSTQEMFSVDGGEMITLAVAGAVFAAVASYCAVRSEVRQSGYRDWQLAGYKARQGN